MRVRGRVHVSELPALMVRFAREERSKRDRTAVVGAAPSATPFRAGAMSKVPASIAPYLTEPSPAPGFWDRMREVPTGAWIASGCALLVGTVAIFAATNRRKNTISK